MKRILFSLIAFLAIGSNIYAFDTLEDIIQVDDVEITAGDEMSFDIIYNSGDAPESGIKGCQFEICLPEGFSLKLNKKGKIIVDNVQDDFTVTPRIVDDTHIRFIMFSTVDEDLVFDDEEPLFTLTLVADPNVIYGIYPATVQGYGMLSNIQLTAPSDEGDITYLQENFTFDIILPLELNEELSYAEGFGNYPKVNVIMNTRKLKADTWNTICLPFNMDADAIKAAFGENNQVTLATLAGSETVRKDGVIKDIIIKFDTSSSTEISANTPYLIKLKDAVETFTVERVSVSDEEAIASAGDATFVGNYEVIENLGEDTPALFISSNKFYYATGNSKLKSFRGYFTHTDLQEYIDAQSAGANISLFVDGEPTGIRNIVTTQDNNDIYDISGRKVNSDKTPLQKGVYIINGKKETVH